MELFDARSLTLQECVPRGPTHALSLQCQAVASVAADRAAKRDAAGPATILAPLPSAAGDAAERSQYLQLESAGVYLPDGECLLRQGVLSGFPALLAGPQWDVGPQDTWLLGVKPDVPLFSSPAIQGKHMGCDQFLDVRSSAARIRARRIRRWAHTRLSRC